MINEWKNSGMGKVTDAEESALEDVVALFLERLEDDPSPEDIERFMGEYANRSASFRTALDREIQLVLVLARERRGRTTSGGTA